MDHHGHSHQHGHDHAHDHRDSAKGSLKFALAMTATIMIAEFTGGLYTNSLALLADSAHMLTDVAALGMSFFAMWFSTKRATPKKTYGFYRVEILAALLNGVLLVLISLFIFYEAYGRLMNPPEIKANWMFVVAAVGLCANLASAYMLFGKHDNLNVRGALFHVLSDVVGSVGAIIASLAILFGGFVIADPLISLIVAVLILLSSWTLIRDAVDILLEGTPPHIDIVGLRTKLHLVAGVGSIHDLHVWTLTSGVMAMSCHVVATEAGLNRTEILHCLKTMARDQFHIDHTTIQIEEPNAPHTALDSCDCQFGAWDTPPAR